MSLFDLPEADRLVVLGNGELASRSVRHDRGIGDLRISPILPNLWLPPFLALGRRSEVFLGTLDDAPYDIKPMLEVWTIHRDHWLPAVPDVPRHEQNPHGKCPLLIACKYPRLTGMGSTADRQLEVLSPKAAGAIR